MSRIRGDFNRTANRADANRAASRFTAVYLCLDALEADPQKVDSQKEFLPSLQLLALELEKRQLELHVLGATSNRIDRMAIISYRWGEYFSSQSGLAARMQEVAAQPENLLVIFYHRPGSPYLLEFDNSYFLPALYFKGAIPENATVYDYSTAEQVRAETLAKYSRALPAHYPLTFPQEIPPGCQNKDYLYLTYVLVSKLFANSIAKVGVYTQSFAQARSDPVAFAQLGVKLVGYFRSLSPKIYGSGQKAEVLLAQVRDKLEQDFPGSGASARFAQVAGIEAEARAEARAEAKAEAKAAVKAATPAKVAAVPAAKTAAGYNANSVIAGLAFAGLAAKGIFGARPEAPLRDWRDEVQIPRSYTPPAVSGFKMMQDIEKETAKAPLSKGMKAYLEKVSTRIDPNMGNLFTLKEIDEIAGRPTVELPPALRPEEVVRPEGSRLAPAWMIENRLVPEEKPAVANFLKNSSMKFGQF